MKNLPHRLFSNGILIADGAMGTQLHRLGLPIGMPPELWNLQKPWTVRSIHRHYVDAGSDFILTNTFGGTRLRLAQAGLGDQVTEINTAAVKLAQQEAKGALVIGSIGPTDPSAAPSACRAAYAQQALILVDAGVDALLIETMVDLNEASLALQGIIPIVDVPVMVTMAFDEYGNTFAGQSPTDVANTLAELNATAIGANCCSSISGLLAAVDAMHIAQPSIPIIAKPNAGLPHFHDGQPNYDLSPDTLATYVQPMLDAGVQVIGSCCGSTPSHITAIKQASVLLQAAA